MTRKSNFLAQLLMVIETLLTMFDINTRVIMVCLNTVTMNALSQCTETVNSDHYLRWVGGAKF